MSEENNIETVDTVVESTDNSLLSGNEPVKEAPAVTQEVVTEEPVDNSSFLNSVPDEYKTFVEKKGFKDLGSTLKSLQNLESKFGKRFEDLTPEEIKSLNTKLGAPETVDGYELNLSDELKDDPILANIGEDLLKAGISKDKAQALLGSVTSKLENLIKEQETEMQLKAQEEIESIKKEYGSAFNQRLDLANNALREFGGEEAIQALNSAGLSNNPAIFKMLSEVGKLIAEDVPAGNKDTRNFGVTPEEADAKIAELRSDPAFAARLRDVRDPGHNEAIAQLEKYYKLRSGKR